MKNIGKALVLALAVLLFFLISTPQPVFSQECEVFQPQYGDRCCGGSTPCSGISCTWGRRACLASGASEVCNPWSCAFYFTAQCAPSGSGCAQGCSTAPTITVRNPNGSSVPNNSFVAVNTTDFLMPLNIELSQCSTATGYEVTVSYLRPDNTYAIVYDSYMTTSLRFNPTLNFNNRWSRWRIWGNTGHSYYTNGTPAELYFYPVKVIARVLSFTQESALINWEVGLPPGLTGNPNIYLNLGSTDTLIRSYTTPTLIDSDGLSQYQGTYLIQGSGLNLQDNLYRWSLKMSLDGGTTKTVISSGKLPRVALFRVAFPTGPWIQTIGGDVHSNIRIHTPGGP